MNSPRMLLDARNLLGESPVWCPRTQSLWWIDVQQPTLWRWHHTTGRAQSWPLPKPPATLALLDDGRLLIVFRKHIAVLESPAAELKELDIAGLVLGDERFNDGKVDRLGRLWLGTFDRALSRPLGRLYRMSEDTSLHVVDSGFLLSNGMGWSPDSRAMYFAETRERRIYRYDFDLASGTASNRSVLVQLPDGPGGPDGLTVDAAGYIWCALFERGCVHRYRPTGELECSVALPVSRPTSCAIGGPDMRTLYVTSARYGLSDQELAEQPAAGAVFCVDLDERGMVEQCLHLQRDSLATQAA
jgi:sugar lactone lactonase YvrE